MSPRRITAYAGRGLLVLFAGFIVFDLASACAIARGAPFYVALAIGALACPILPLVWHVLGERKRKRKRAAMKKPPTASTTALVRLLLRAGTVGVAVIGILVGLMQGSWDAFRHHALWFVPRAEPKLSTASDLVALVPANADSVFWVRPTQAVSDALTTLGADAQALETVYATGVDSKTKAYDAALITRLPGGVLPAPPAWSKVFDVIPTPTLTVGPVATPLGPSWRATRSWAGAIGSGPPAALVALLGRAPDDAVAVFATKTAHVPATDDDLEAFGYVTVRDQRLALTADGTLVSPAAAARFRAEAEGALATARVVGFTAVTCLQGHGATFELTTEGAAVHLRASVDVDAVRACLPLR